METAPAPAAGSSRLCISSTTWSVILETVSLRHRGAVDLGEVRRDLPGGQAAGGQRQHDLIDPGQPPLPLLHNLRLNVASMSRGTSISTGPISVSTVFDRTPLRELPRFRPTGSCLS